MHMTERPSATQLLKNSKMRQNFGMAVACNPYELYGAIDSSGKRDDFSSNVVNHLFSDYEGISTTFNKPDAYTLIRETVTDSQAIWDGALSDAPDITKKEALQVVKHPISTFVVATMVGFNQGTLTEITNSPQRRDIYRVNNSRQRLIIGSLMPAYAQNMDGCPYAGHIDGRHEPGKSDPLFRQAVSWAGTLAILRYFDEVEQPPISSVSHVA